MFPPFLQNRRKLLHCISETSFRLGKKGSFLLVYKCVAGCKSFPKWRWCWGAGVQALPCLAGGGMIKLRSLLHVRGLSGHPTMRECLGPSLGANKLYFDGKYFSLFTGFLCFHNSEWKISSTQMAIMRIWVSRTLLPFLWVLLILLHGLVRKN